MFKNLTMWHEARKQERKIRDLIVDYKKRAERRRDFYEKIKADPTQFLQLHGRQVKIHLDPAIAAAGDSPANMMPWQGHSDVLIDRFDVRAHLDLIPDYPEKTEPPTSEELTREERLINYERYRIIVQNDFLGVDEEKFLHQLYLEEQFGMLKPAETPSTSGPIDGKKKRNEKATGAAIPYTYDSPVVTLSDTITADGDNGDESSVVGGTEEDKDDDDDDSDIDFDLCVDVSQVNPQQAHQLNVCGSAYGMNGNDFFSFLNQDIEEKESLRQAREQEEEKAMYSGRKSRRERRAFRERRLQGRKISPPSYAARTSPTYDPYRISTSKSRSRSHSPVNTGQITYITSFGGEEDEDAGGTSRPTAALHHLQSSSGAAPQNRINRRSRSPTTKQSSSSRYRHRGRERSNSPHHRRRSGSSPNLYRHRSHSRERITGNKWSRSRSPHSSDCKSRVRHKKSLSPSENCRSPINTSTKPSESVRKSKSPSSRLPPPPVRRYYGRRGKSSSSELEDSDSEEKKEPSPSRPVKPLITTKTLNSGFGNSGAGIKTAVKLTPQERLKRKMQALLNRQYKADKRAERMRYEKMEQERQDREDELREMAIKLRRRERERRHRMKEGDEEMDDELGPENERLSMSSLESYSPSPSPSPPHSSTSSYSRHGGNGHSSTGRSQQSSAKKNRWSKLLDDEGERGDDELSYRETSSSHKDQTRANYRSGSGSYRHRHDRRSERESSSRRSSSSKIGSSDRKSHSRSPPRRSSQRPLVDY